MSTMASEQIHVNFTHLTCLFFLLVGLNINVIWYAFKYCQAFCKYYVHCSKSTSNSTKSKESKEGDREKQISKESDKTRNHEKPDRSKRTSPNGTDSPRDDYDKGTFLRWLITFSTSVSEIKEIASIVQRTDDSLYMRYWISYLMSRTEISTCFKQVVVEDIKM